jgi:hypothetical protein
MSSTADLLADARRALLDERRQLTLGELGALAALPLRVPIGTLSKVI